VLSILINWLYMGSMVFFSGMALLQGYGFIMQKVNKSDSRPDFGTGYVLVAGLLGTVLYAQIFSLFYRVNIEANILLIALILFYAIANRKYIRSFFSKRKINYGVCALLGLVVLAYAAASAGKAVLIDTHWYHAQTIRWIEELGCVKGTANLFYALGFNNAQHYFDALFSMEWLFGQSLRGTGGFAGLFLMIHGILRLSGFRKHSRHTADALAMGEILYSIIVTAFFTEAYVDTLPNALVLFIFTEWFVLLEKEKNDTSYFGLLCLFGVFAVVLKTSVAMVVCLTAYPVYLFVKQKKVWQIFLYTGMGFCICLPYLITNVIVTGYPIYLFSWFDVFPVHWKIDVEVMKYMVDNMVASARNPAIPMDVALNCGLDWVPVWFRNESISHRILYLGIFALLLFDVIHMILDLIRKRKPDGWVIFPRICVYMGLVYWFFTIPQVKYCWAFLILPLVLVPCYYYEHNSGIMEKLLLLLAGGIFVLYAGFYSLRTFGYVKTGITMYPIMQADYDSYELEEVEKDGLIFYQRKDGGDIVCGYHVFPYLENKDSIDRLVVGDKLKDGFYFRE